MEARGAVDRLARPDGSVFPVWREPAREARRGGLILAHAIWGITPHLRALAAEWAEAGWEVLIPSLFERFGPGLAERDTDPAQLDLRMGWGAETGWGEACLPEVAACIPALAPPAAILGFCFGGTVAWLSACRLPGLSAAACFYGGHIWDRRMETPLCPTMLHFGREDATIPLAKVDDIAALHEGLPLHLYPAAHAFVAPSGFHADSAQLSMLRTRAFLHRALGARGEV